MNKPFICSLAFGLAAMGHASTTIATFADPTTVADSAMFTWDMDAGTISGAWTANGLTLETPGFNGGGSMTDVHYLMDPVTVTPVGSGYYQMGAGQIRFFTTDPNDVFMTIDFAGGSFLAPFNIGASQITGPSVSFTGPNLPTQMTDETFSFALTNAKQVGNFVTYTTSFTSSGTVVPEPASLMFAIAGAASLLARRKRV